METVLKTTTGSVRGLLEESGAMSTLLKRRKYAKRERSPIDWIPGAGVPCYSFGPPDQRQRNEKLFRTSLLFRQLEVNSYSCPYIVNEGLLSCGISLFGL